MKKNLLISLCAICALFYIPVSVQAGEYWINLGDTALSAVMPVVPGNSTYTSVVQEIYFASELRAAGASSTGGNITAITFRYGGKLGTTAVSAQTRGVQIYLNKIDASVDGFDVNSSDHKLFFKAPGSKVFEGQLKIRATAAGKTDTAQLVLNTPFAWNGTDNILLTVYDTTNTGFSDANLRFVLTAPTADNTARFVHVHQTQARASSDFSTFRPSNLAGQKGEIFSSPNTDAGQIASHKWVNKVLFTIVTPIPAPTSPTSSDITSSSATIGWTAAAGADSYEVRYGTTSGSLGAATNVGNVTSYALSDLEDGVTYYYQIRTKKGTEYSAWTDEASFNTTAIVHEHNGISFSKWSSTSSLPAEAGDYYLNADVVLTSNYTVPGNINLCLNGHSIYTYAYYITVPDNKTLAVYDNVGGGRIYGYYAVEIDYSNNGLITIAADGTLILNGVSIENLANEFNEGEAAYGIYSVGTLKISGASVISGYDADIYLYDGKVITIEEGKPLTNTTPYRILRGNTGDITSGWTNMNGANPGDYLTSAPPARGVCLNGTTGEARYVRRLRIDEDGDNDDISDAIYASQLINVAMTRSLTSSQYNTFCLPFALTDAQLQEYFGAGYDLEEFVGSSLDGDVLSLSFNKVTALEAGKPYLLQPSVDVVNPSFEGVTIAETSPVDQTSDTYISFHGTFAPTELAGGNKNLLFLGSGNELFWPASTGNIKAFRAYFEVKGDARKAAKRARIVHKENTTTGVDQVSAKFGESDKLLRNGQLLIIRDNKTYNVLGQPVQL